MWLVLDVALKSDVVAEEFRSQWWGWHGSCLQPCSEKSGAGKCTSSIGGHKDITWDHCKSPFISCLYSNANAGWLGKSIRTRQQWSDHIFPAASNL